MTCFPTPPYLGRKHSKLGKAPLGTALADTRGAFSLFGRIPHLRTLPCNRKLGSGSPKKQGGVLFGVRRSMKRITYRKYTDEDLGVSAEDLMQALSDFFLQSGYQDPYSSWQAFDPNAMEELLRQIQQALESGDLFPDDQRQEMLDRLMRMSGDELNQLMRNLADKLRSEGFIQFDGDLRGATSATGPGQAEAPREREQVYFEVTDKSLDFLASAP